MTSRRPTAMVVAAVILAAAIVLQTDIAASSAAPTASRNTQSQDSRPPTPVRTIDVTRADASSVSLAWARAMDDVGVSGYGVYLDRHRVAVTRQPGHVFRGLGCGMGYVVGVDAFDAAGNRSTRSSTTISTAGCVDLVAPAEPAHPRSLAVAESSVVLAWDDSADDVGVVGYGLYVGGFRVGAASEATSTLTGLDCGEDYLLGIDAVDAAGNRSQRKPLLVSTAACPAPVSTSGAPTGAPSSATGSMALMSRSGQASDWSSSLTDGAVVAPGSVWQLTFKDGNPDEVDFWASGKKLSTDTSAPFEVRLELPEGEHRLGFCYRKGGQQTCAAPEREGVVHTVRVAASTPTPTPAPTPAPAPTTPTTTAAWASSLTDGAVVAPGSVWQLTFKDGNPDEVDFWASGKKLSTDTSAPFEVRLELPEGEHRLGFCYRKGGQQTCAAPEREGVVHTVRVAASTPTPTPTPTPAPAPTTPTTTAAWASSLTDGAVVAPGSVWQLTFKDGNPDEVDFWASGKKLSTDTSAPFEVRLELPEGEHRLGFCYRKGGQQTCAAPEREGVVHTVRVAASTPTPTPAPAPQPNAPTTPVPAPTTPTPTVPWSSSLTDGAVVAPGTMWRVTFDQAPDKVDFWADGALLATDTTPPFETRLRLPAGTHKIGFCYQRTGRPQTCASPETEGVVATVTITSTSTETPPPSDTTPPGSPGSVGATAASATSVTIAWSPSSDNVGVTGYGLYRGTGRVATAAQAPYTFTGLSCGTAYQVGVDAYDAAGYRSQRVDVTVTTAACTDRRPPASPLNVVATTRTATSIALTWSPPADDVGVVGYGLYRAGSLVGTTAGTTGIFSDLTCGTNHTLAVAAYDAAGNWSAPTTVMVATTACSDGQVPTTPTGLVASAVAQTSLTLTWATATDNVGVTGYDVFRNGTKIGTTTETRYAQTGLACATTYSFAVAAYDAAGNRSPQATVSVRTAACAVTGAAQVYVAPNGNDSTCQRSTTSPCQTFNRAYQIAQLGDVVEVAGGTYAAQQIRQEASKDSTGDLPDVVFKPASGATVRVAGVDVGTQCYGLSSSCYTGPDHLTIKNMTDARSPQGPWNVYHESNDVTLENIDASNFYVVGVRDLKVLGGDWGPCSYGVQNCLNNKVDMDPNYRNERVLIEGGTYHDIRINTQGQHMECMFLVGRHRHHRPQQPVLRLRVLRHLRPVLRRPQLPEARLQPVRRTRLGRQRLRPPV